jgi:hypothetical protein
LLRHPGRQDASAAPAVPGWRWRVSFHHRDWRRLIVGFVAGGASANELQQKVKKLMVDIGTVWILVLGKCRGNCAKHHSRDGNKLRTTFSW